MESVKGNHAGKSEFGSEEERNWGLGKQNNRKETLNRRLKTANDINKIEPSPAGKLEAETKISRKKMIIFLYFNFIISIQCI